MKIFLGWTYSCIRYHMIGSKSYYHIYITSSFSIELLFFIQKHVKVSKSLRLLSFSLNVLLFTLTNFILKFFWGGNNFFRCVITTKHIKSVLLIIVSCSVILIMPIEQDILLLNKLTCVSQFNFVLIWRP